jgi:large subunit ribosomal protein L2
MPLKTFKPTSPARRQMTMVTNEGLTKGARPPKSLIAPMRRTGGRNAHGWQTNRNIGGGHKKRYRIIDFKRDKDGIAGVVSTLEYDPNRSSRIALVTYKDGEKRYIIAADALRVGQSIVSGAGADIIVGNSLPLKEIPLGTMIHAIELKPGHGAQLVRSAGTQAQLVAREGDYAQVKLPSGEVRMVRIECRATIGQVGNIDHSNVTIGKAGRSRWMGIRPHVRGVAKNPVDHPMGGGEGKTSGGRHPCTPWGVPTKGYKTVRNKPTLKFIVKPRGKK